MNDRLHRVIGIDLGTTYSAVAAYDSHLMSPEIIPDPLSGKVSTPSVVWLNAVRKAVVGDDAKTAILSEPEKTVIEIKREMGGTFTEELLDKYGARGVFSLRDLEDPQKPPPPIKVFFGGDWLLPQEISALILMRMKKIAEAEMGGEIHDAVVTVPAYFKEPRKDATKEAALLAGLYPRQLIPEPTAAAYCYGVDTAEQERKVYLVYDLGGGTFDVSIIVAQENLINVIATSGDPRLGGGDFDDAITEWVMGGLGLDPSAHPGLTRQIKARAEDAKRELSVRESTEVLLPPLPDGRMQPAVPLDRPTFESLIEATLGKSLEYVDDAIADAEKADIARASIDAVLLVGGSTRIPFVKQMLLRHFDKSDDFVRSDVDPDTVVARGAALVARQFAPSERFVIAMDNEGSLILPEATLASQDAAGETEIRLITEHTLGVGLADNTVDPLISKGTYIPYQRTKTGYTNPEGANRVMCSVYQGNGEYVYEDELIGTIELGRIEPPFSEGAAHYDVSFSLDVNGLLSVGVKHVETGDEYTGKFEPSTRLGEQNLDARRRKLEELFDQEQLAPPGAKAPIEAPPAAIPPPVTAGTPAEPPAGATEVPVMQVQDRPSSVEPVPAVPALPEATYGQPAAAAPAGSALLAIEAEVPAEFRQTVRRVQRFLLQQPDDALAVAYNSFAAAVNSETPVDELEELADDLAETFDDVRLRLR